MVKKKSILIIGAGLEQAIAIKKAKTLGLHIIACDGNPDAVGLKEADIGLTVDIQDENELFMIAKEYSVDGIFCHAVEIPQVIARVARRLKLPGLDPEVAERATNKTKRISHLINCGIPCAKFDVVHEKGELIEKGTKIGFPLVLKPIDNAGSRGVRIVKGKADLYDAYETAIGYSKTKEVLIEEVLSGPEISTESVVYKGKIYTFAFADRNYSRNKEFYPFFMEDGINFPSKLSKDEQDEIYRLVENTVKCLGIDFGAAKGDIIIDKGQPKIIEMAARTSGGWFGAGSIPIATGKDMLKPLLQMAVGDEPDLDALKPTRMLGCAQRYIIPTLGGIVDKITGIEDALASPGVAMHTLFLPKIGTRIRKATNHAERYGQIICTGDTREQAMERCEAAIAKIKIHLRD
jgi:biotin carboxylase